MRSLPIAAVMASDNILGSVQNLDLVWIIVHNKILKLLDSITILTTAGKKSYFIGILCGSERKERNAEKVNYLIFVTFVQICNLPVNQSLSFTSRYEVWSTSRELLISLSSKRGQGPELVNVLGTELGPGSGSWIISALICHIQAGRKYFYVWL